MGAELDLYALLKQHWGYDTFRRRQEEIVRGLVAGRDVVAVMPTGGGKSLCYQLAALVLEGTAIVISPLIALMQDQVAQLEEMGIAAAMLNSSMDYADQRRVMQAASDGRYRLLYLSPERLARDDTAGWLQRLPLSFFAIDEAHCISEWGHEFRPEYRRLGLLRETFPDKPLAAFTASATARVRRDIVSQLALREPDKFVLSFHRPNLRLLVRNTNADTQEALLLSAMQEHEGENVIIYSPTIARVDQTIALLAENGIAALSYHGKMDSETRQRNQVRWMSDEVRVLVGTIAFGLGINKASVRAVVHLSLPKSLEQFYQEAGRAGRDGDPSDCLLLWQNRDAGLLAHFITEVEDPDERSRAWERYRIMRRFVEEDHCRHRQICSHFGQRTSWESCGACDVCGNSPEWFLKTQITTARRKKPSRKAAAEPKKPPPSIVKLPESEQRLLDHLREWRRKMAQISNAPAFVILHDASLADLCIQRPRTREELLGVHGIGPGKVERYGEDLLAAIREFEAGG